MTNDKGAVLENTGIFQLAKKSNIQIQKFENEENAQIALFSGSRLKFYDSVNKGHFQAGYLKVPEGERFVNDGTILLEDIRGKGTFQNHKDLRLMGTVEEPASVSIQNFENGNVDGSKSGKINRSHVMVTPDNKTFINHQNAKIYSEGTFSKKTGDFTNKGT